MKSKKRRQKNCGEIAMVRARHARHQKKNPFLVGLAFIAALLPMRSPAIFPVIPRRVETDDDWPISDYERGYSTSPRLRRERYRERPTMKRLMFDLRRPAACKEAERFLLTRINDDGLREWVSEQVREDRVNRLSIYVRYNLSDDAVIASWQAELDAENSAADEAANEASTQANVMQTLAGIMTTGSSTKMGPKC